MWREVRYLHEMITCGKRRREKEECKQPMMDVVVR